MRRCWFFKHVEQNSDESGTAISREFALGSGCAYCVYRLPEEASITGGSVISPCYFDQYQSREVR